MSCPICQHCPAVPACGGTVHVGSRVPDLMLKLIGGIHTLGSTFVVEDGEVRGDVASFSQFLSDFQSHFAWNSLEKDSLFVLFLRPNEPFSFKASLETRTLSQWDDLQGAKVLGDLIEQKRVVTWFHPIWDTSAQSLFGWECLIRGLEPNGAVVPPGVMFGQARRAGMTFPLDRLARLTALQTAKDKGIGTHLFINFIPTAIYDPVFCLKTTVDLAESLQIANERIVFEVVETEQIQDWQHLKTIVDFYKDKGFKIALDDVGSGYSSLNLLAGLKPDILKVDLEIVRGIHADPVKQSVFRALAGISRENGSRLLAEGVETVEELDFVVREGADLAQGFLWGPPRPEPDERISYRQEGASHGSH